MEKKLTTHYPLLITAVLTVGFSIAASILRMTLAIAQADKVIWATLLSGCVVDLESLPLIGAV